jgi:DNA-binding PadR family transcriptional regulator
MSVRNAILGLLVQRPRHGYELRSAFEALMGGEQNWEVKPAQIYTTLSRLEESGLVAQTAVEQDGGPEKRIYDITPAGRVELAGWFNGAVEDEPQRDEFYLKLMLCLATSAADPYKVIQVQRARLYRSLHQLTTRRLRLDQKIALAQVLLLDKAVMHVEADLRWLDMVEGRLDDIRRHPPPEPESKPRGRPKKGKID